MAALTALPLLSLNARPDAKTQFIVEGNGFNNTTTVTVTDLNTAAPYTFLVTTVEYLTAKRLLVEVKCTPATTAAAQAKIRILATTGANIDDSGPVPTIFRTRQHLTLAHEQLEKPVMPLFLNKKKVLRLPVTGFGDVITGSVESEGKGRWKLLKAKQKKKWVAVLVECIDTAITYVAPPITGCLTVTLIAEDGQSIDVPMDAEYTKDPDEEP